MTTTTTALRAPPVRRRQARGRHRSARCSGFWPRRSCRSRPPTSCSPSRSPAGPPWSRSTTSGSGCRRCSGCSCAYGAATVVSALSSADPADSLIDCKQLVLFLIVPVVYRFARGRARSTFATVIISVGAISALVGIVQYGVLHYDNLGKRPQGALTPLHDLFGGADAGRLRRRGAAALPARARPAAAMWTALVMPACVVALAFTFTRSAWVGACRRRGLLLVAEGPPPARRRSDRRSRWSSLLAPASVTARMYSIFDVNDPTNRDRFAMLKSGVEMVRDHPLTGVGPDMVKRGLRRVPRAVGGRTR